MALSEGREEGVPWCMEAFAKEEGILENHRVHSIYYENGNRELSTAVAVKVKDHFNGA